MNKDTEFVWWRQGKGNERISWMTTVLVSRRQYLHKCIHLVRFYTPVIYVCIFYCTSYGLDNRRPTTRFCMTRASGQQNLKRLLVSSSPQLHNRASYEEPSIIVPKA